eukprot:SAG31_NODE_5950_length_2244_cov_1.525408_2_plen_67_part_00
MRNAHHSGCRTRAVLLTSLPCTVRVLVRSLSIRAVRGEKRHTEVVEANLAPIWDETMIFDFRIESQ